MTRENETDQHSVTEDLRRRAESAIKGSDGSVESLSRFEIDRLVHELRVHHVELEMQNEELRRTKADLESSRARYFDLFNQAPVGYMSVSIKGLILEANLTATSLLGIDRNMLSQRPPLSIFIYPQDWQIYYLHRNAVTDKGQAQCAELRMIKSDQTVFWARLNTTLAQQEASDIPITRTVITDLTDIKNYETQLKAAVSEREVMLREIHHRVKNNMQVISSLLFLQESSVKSPPEARIAFSEARNRIHSMALVHELLYGSKSLAELDLQTYLEKLTLELHQAFLRPDSKVALEVNAFGIRMGVTQTIPFGLILTELLVNSLKYAFPSDREGEIRIDVRLVDGKTMEARIADNGIGFPSDIDPAASETLGLRLVVTLVTNQLEGTWSLEREGGTCWALRWPVG